VDDYIAELQSCVTTDAVDAYLGSHPELIGAQSVEALAEAVRHKVRVDPREALRLADAAQAIAARVAAPRVLGLSDRAKANALWYSGDLKSAVILFDNAAAEFEQAGIPEEIGRTLSSSIQPLALLGEYERAFAAAAKARDIFETVGDPLRMARLEINVANIHHRQDRFADAFAAYRRAYQELAPHKDTEAMAVALHNMAVCLIALNDFDQALETYSSARQLCDSNDMPRLAAQADYNIAFLYFLRGDYRTALERLRLARELCLEHQDAYHAALCDVDQSEIYIELNLTDEAAQLASRAQGQFEQLGMAFETGRSIVNQAIAHHYDQNWAEAFDLFSRAAAIFEREGNRAWQALIALYQAIVLLDLARPQEAAALCEPALDFFESAGLERRAVFARILLARIMRALGDPQQTCRHCRLALDKLQTLDAPQLEFRARVLLAGTHRDAGRLEESYEEYRRARVALETLRSGVHGEELKIAFMREKLDAYESLVDICIQRGAPEAAAEAFSYMELAKSRTLLDAAIDRLRALPWLDADHPAAARVRALREEINWYYRRIDIEQTRAERVSAPEINALWTQAREKESRLTEAVRELPDRAEAKLAYGAHVLAADEVSEAIGSDAVLIEYFEAAGELLAAVVGPKRTTVERLGSAADVARSVGMLHFQISRRQSQGFDGKILRRISFDAVSSRLHELYAALIQPLEPLLEARRLVIVPHGALHRAPFHALFDGAAYLIDRYAISYAPSASLYALCANRRANTGGALVLGVPDQRAPWITQEVRSVGRVLSKSLVYEGAEATLDVLRTHGPASAILHIATHGAFRADNPMFSTVTLADSYLNLYDLYSLRIPAEIVTLSGCATGLAMAVAADELLGLVRGLLSTGAQSLLLSLWDVHDRTAASFMASFYTHWRRRGRTKADALRAAMIETRTRHPHPYFWAPYVLVGKAVD
jgi:CHAT domain-containing protein/tetratricopeptide (TPR) repeat protein